MKISLEDRIYGLSTLWKEAAYNFASWDELEDLDWDKAYQEFLPKVIEAEDPLLYYAELMKFIALLKDGHTYVVMPESMMLPYTIPIGTTFKENKHVLTAVPKNSGIELFSEILEINEIPIEKYIDQYVLPYVWHEKLNSRFSYGLLGNTINCCESGTIEITTNNGSFSFEKGIDVETIGWGALTHPEFEKMQQLFKSKTHTIYRTTDHIVYIDIPTFALSEFKEELYKNIDLIKDCKGIIIDVRNNDGGNTHNSDAVAQLFFEGEFLNDYVKSPVHIASFKAHGKFRNIDELDLNDPWQKKIFDVCKHNLYEEENEMIHIKECPAYLSQPVVILSGCNTASAGESFIANMKYKNRATLVGEASYGSNGQPYMGGLPGGGWYGICTHKCYLADGTSYNNKGIEPDILVGNSIEDCKNQFDNVFDKGIQTIRSLCHIS